ncbi:Asp23/Gls24 family envelope stress response protein [Anaerosphaera multitolerans]|uniref:Asp23/Gls24 family envelope stress response protein n=1 Tax=Anaerosphaera multitolerans TaxID=2487351 RepID=A0A437S7R1_9FIRM|nr:Asp23/Gls24 family envelope stress response protein [Anaerosphaera multitolerans]RVU54958.1 Asp23/Gls24 family envelope stress response protein [Anaerosphaera multitolerans]
MSDNYLIDGVNNGDVKISEEVIATIAVVAIEEIEGVVEMQSSLKTSVTDMLGVKNLSKGVKVSIGENEAVIDAFITVEYGKNIIELGKEVQKNVKEAVENMTGLDVVEVNVHISGIAMADKEKAKA